MRTFCALAHTSRLAPEPPATLTDGLPYDDILNQALAAIRIETSYQLGMVFENAANHFRLSQSCENSTTMAFHASQNP